MHKLIVIGSGSAGLAAAIYAAAPTWLPFPSPGAIWEARWPSPTRWITTPVPLKG